jgi:hypothetical protein
MDDTDIKMAEQKPAADHLINIEDIHVGDEDDFSKFHGFIRYYMLYAC